MLNLGKLATSTTLVALTVLSAVACSKGGAGAKSNDLPLKVEGLKLETSERDNFKTSAAIVPAAARKYKFNDNGQDVLVSVRAEGEAGYEQSGKALVVYGDAQYAVEDYCNQYSAETKSCGEVAVTIARIKSDKTEVKSILLVKSADAGYDLVCSRDQVAATIGETFAALKKECAPPQTAAPVAAPTSVQD